MDGVKRDRRAEAFDAGWDARGDWEVGIRRYCRDYPSLIPGPVVERLSCQECGPCNGWQEMEEAILANADSHFIRELRIGRNGQLHGRAARPSMFTALKIRHDIT